MRLLTRYAVKNQYVASTAACAFAPKPATQTLISADHSMGATACGPRCQFIETRMAGGGCRASDAHPMDAKKKTDGECTGCTIRLGRRHEARCVADSRARQRNVAVLCQSHRRSQHHVDQR